MSEQRQRQGVCRYYNSSGGCRRGVQCTFLHPSPPDSSAGVSSLPAPQSFIRTVGPSSPAPQSSSAFSGGAPPGACRVYWNTGKCRHEFTCRFRHTVNPTSGPAAAERPGDQRPTTTQHDDILPFLTDAGLAKVTGAGTDIFFSISQTAITPNEAHNHLKRFLYDDYRFRKTFDVYAFVSILNHASTSNTSWSNEDGQLLLASVASDNGLLRVRAILKWAPVSTRAGSQQQTMSFQRGIIPLLRYISSEFVLKSTLGTLVNSLYMCVVDNIEQFSTTIQESMDAICQNRSFKDPLSGSSTGVPLGSQVFAALASVVYECLTRFKNIMATCPQLVPLVKNIPEWYAVWEHGLNATPPDFNDPLSETTEAARDHIMRHLKSKIDRLVAIVDREERKIERATQRSNLASLKYAVDHSNEGILSALHSTYEGAGTERREGPRHDNDFLEIDQIRVAPTHQELTCHIPPFLPSNFYGAPHHLPESSMERLLDIQFRLLREELTAPLRTAIGLILDDLLDDHRVRKTETKLSKLLQDGGGKYRGHALGQDGIMFNVYADVKLHSLVPDRRGLSTNLSIQTPPGRARSAQANVRVSFWEGTSGKRFMQGGLIALVWKRGTDVSVHLGVLSSSMRSITDSARISQHRLSIGVVFFDPSIQERILQGIKYPSTVQHDTIFLTEAPVMFEAIRPFLEALQVEPESIPFGQYLVHHPPGHLSSTIVGPPSYSLVPGFSFQLSSLCEPDAGVTELSLSVTDPSSVEFARIELKQKSRLDNSQVDAIVDTLTREVSLIQGPPGTGKSYTGVELIRVLLENGIRPILLIAFTNHALDHMLCSVLDAEITRKIARLGSRSADERMSQFSLDKLEQIRQSRLGQAFRANYRGLKNVEDEIKKLMTKFQKTDPDVEEITRYIQIQYPEHHEHITNPPLWVSVIAKNWMTEGWSVQGRNGAVSEADDSLYTLWRSGQDLQFLESKKEETPASHLSLHSNRFELLASQDFAANLRDFVPADITVQAPQGSEDDDESVSETDSEGDELPIEERWRLDIARDESSSSDNVTDASSANEALLEQSNILAPQPTVIQNPSTPPTTPLQLSDLQDPQHFFSSFGLPSVPSIPSFDRSLDLLLEEGTMWSMSIRERQRLHHYWNETVRTTTHSVHLEEFERLRQRLLDVQKKNNEGQDEARRELLKNMDIIGCTTTGAAKLTSLLKGLEPRVMLVEEAGQVLEAHILGSLVPSIEHLILIGDPMQLRPTLNNFSLSMDSRQGRELYKFDMSLMERLAKSGMDMSLINVQRRMRPAVSDLIRKTLYPALIDHDAVKSYPDVRGLAKNVFFVNHEHKENGGFEDSASKYNTYEVEMIRDLVLYLLRQGSYSQEGDIVVLCAYLGQLARLRDALADKVAVIIDDRDQAELAERLDEQEGEREFSSRVEHVKISQRVRLRTVDNFQGEEGKIVILSLVRNSGALHTDELGHTSGGRANIGFLKSDNRTNVALSRAKEGLFIFGNASNLASRSPMWHKVLEQLADQHALGDGLPIVCHQHPDAIQYISEPGKLSRVAPDGGCLRPCSTKLKCGHLCPYKCHPDDPEHVTVTCIQPCRRLCDRGHPCYKQCRDDCGDCTFSVYQVGLPCGHVKDSVPCYLLDALEDVACNVMVNKSLPNCEHVAQLRCSEEPGQYQCAVPCGVQMSCCGRSCRAPCHRCQQLGEIAAGQDDLSRSNHARHTCERSLYCGHRCQNPCSETHQCTTNCREACQQICAHSRCKKSCGTPCAPCQEACVWKCSHSKLQCPVPCGSVCARLPCDKRCEKVLSCGHRCPTVCGEDCALQICPICASDDRKNSVVDLILQRSMSEVDVSLETLDELLITIPNCGHVFTVETLDGLCSIDDYYRRDANTGNWLGLQAPPHDLRNPPSCPTCRAAITCPRYGRIFKPANLAILERNIASRMSQSIQRIDQVLGSISTPSIQLALKNWARTSTVKGDYHIPKNSKNINHMLKDSKDEPIPWEAFDPEDKDLHGAPPPIARGWKESIGRLRTAYVEALAVARTRSAHRTAWEAAFSCLYHGEMGVIIANPLTAPRRPDEYAMRIAKMNVGQAQPRADRRFLVEAFWRTLEIRFLLAELAIHWREALKEAKPPGTNGKEVGFWNRYINFVLQATVRDAEVALNIATESESYRQVIKTAVFVMRAKAEHFRFNIKMSMENPLPKDDHTKLVARVATVKTEAEGYYTSTLKKWRDALHQSSNSASSAPWSDLQEEFTVAAKAMIQEYAAIKQSLVRGTRYEPVSLEERTAIVKALNFSHTGHWYNCPNGHTFVITECGGAMEQASCPECGAAIGGINHNLEATNTRAMDMEEIGRAQGSGRSPWAWGV